VTSLWSPTGATLVAGVLGDPVRHSLSPVLHNAAFRALGLDWAYLAFEVPAPQLPAAVAGVRALGLVGCNVTMPHKAGVAALVDRRSPVADALDAVNTVVRRGDELEGHNTDGDGFLDALRIDEGVDPAGQRCLVLGAGGAARAVVLALAGAGAADVVVVNRTPSRAEAAATLAGPVGRVGGAEEAEGATLIVNATPVGMVHAAPGPGGDALPIDPARLGPGQLVVDLVYDPPTTPLMVAAEHRGAAVANGLGMLVHQAAHAFTRWTGEPAPVPVMSAAVTAELVARHRRATDGG
jgi:shikimate dehydrogenase